MPLMPIHIVTERVKAKLEAAGVCESSAKVTAEALVLAESQGLVAHGLSRVSQYISHIENGRVSGGSVADVVKRRRGSIVVDARTGLAFPACRLAVSEAINCVEQCGIGIAAVINSHHAGVLVDHLRPAAEAGLVGIAFANAPAVMPAVGGRHAIFGTNPIAAIFPRRNSAPLMIDMSLTEVTRGKIAAAAKSGSPIPLGWAVDAEGQPTTDAAAALAGAMLPIGAASGPKGAMLAMLVELMVSALIGTNFSFEASSFFVDEGNMPRIGQTFIVISPDALAGRESYFDRLDFFVSECLLDDGVRLPGARRESLRHLAETKGLEVSEAMLHGLSLS